MTRVTLLKRTITLFRTYGIPLTGSCKLQHFYREIQMEKAFVDGLIYELEYTLQIKLAEEEWDLVQHPNDLIKLFLEKI